MSPSVAIENESLEEDKNNITSLLPELEALYSKINAAVEKQQSVIDNVWDAQKISAKNLIEYLALRSEDIRLLQNQLHIFGLSSLASSESHILRQLQSIMERLGKQFSANEISACDYYKARRIIGTRSKQLFGEKKDTEIPYIMITFDIEFTDNLPLVKMLLEKGMNVARINCAHDDVEVWQQMIRLVHAAVDATGIPCKIYMDLGGPKMRTTILGRGRFAKKVPLLNGQDLVLAENDANYDPSAVVIGCEQPGIVRQLKAGDRVLFDDGLIETKVTSSQDGIAILRIVRISSKKQQLKSKKGINFPDTELHLPALTINDQSVLPFICEHADLVGYSFVRHSTDIKELQEALAKFTKKPDIIVKIETPEAVANLPSLLIQAMQREIFGVMVARGDLAVEIGFERLSEIQEEILWFSEAAHAPVIWATQVLETLNKSGIATRSEVTDASYAVMAECVMLNKGDHIIKVIETLRDILHRSGGHHVKKRYTFRPMQIASRYFSS